MYNEPCARLTKFMMPKTSVSPAASRKSSTPYWNPFNAWMMKRVGLMAGRRSRARPWSVARTSLHLTFGLIGIDGVGHRDRNGLVRIAVLVAVLDHLEHVEILDRH